MASVNHSSPSVRQIYQALRRGAKEALVANGIQPSTRRGSKELTLAVQRLAQQSYGSLDEATQTGQALGQTIAERSQAQGKTDLDGGIVRQMMLTGEIPTVTKVITKPTKTTPVVVATPKAAVPPATPVPDAVPAMAPIEAIATDDDETPAAPAAEALETEALETEVLEAEPPEAEPLEAEVPEAEALETEVLETEALETEALETEALAVAAIASNVSEPELADAIEPAKAELVSQAEADDDEPAETEVTAVITDALEADALEAKAEPEPAGAAK
ncbi:MAG: hypothetical protein ACOYM4_01660 [Nodosilinea sp.]